jgi:hypothetical protein
MATAIASGIGVGVGVGTAYSAISDLLRTGITWAKWKALGRTVGYDIIADVMQQLLSAEKDEVHGLSTKGMVDAVWGFIDRTTDMSWLLGDVFAQHLFIQMIQQSIAYAIHSSHAGSIGTVCNVYSGGASLSGMSASEVGGNVDLADRGNKGFLSASMGLNIPSMAFELARGVNTRISDVYTRIIQQADSFLDEWNDLALDYYRHYHSMARTRFQDALEMREAVTARAYGFLEQTANEHLARISEQLDTLDGAKAWFDAGLLSSDELKQIALRVDIERQASEANFDAYKDEILAGVETAVSEWDSKVAQALADMKECEACYAVLLKSIFGTLFADVNTFVQIICDEIDKTVEDVCAYRNVKQAVKIEVATELGAVESSPEEEVYRLRYQRWFSIPDITRVYEYQRPTGLAWSEDLEHDLWIPTVTVATVVSRRRFEEVDVSVIKPYTEPTPLTPWESVG